MDMDDDEWDYEWEPCPTCDGEGFIVADCFEDTCCCADPEIEHGSLPCPTCGVVPCP